MVEIGEAVGRRFFIEKDYPSKPNRLILELSQNCNLNCIMCGFGGKPISSFRFMSEELIQTIIKQGDFLSDLHEIRLNGRGESTLHPGFIKIVEYLSELFPKARLTLFTNLMFQDEKILDNLLENNVNLFVSIDSPKKENLEFIRKGTRFDLLMRRIKMLKGGFLVFTLQDCNVNEITDIGRFSKEQGLGLIINVVRTDDKEYEKNFLNTLCNKWEDILKQLSSLHALIPKKELLIPDQIWGRKIPEHIATTISCGTLKICPNLLSEMMIASDGNVFPCNMFNPETYGSIHEVFLEKLWVSIKRLSLIDSYKEHYYCRNCEYMIPRITEF